MFTCMFTWNKQNLTPKNEKNITLRVGSSSWLTGTDYTNKEEEKIRKNILKKTL